MDRCFGFGAELHDSLMQEAIALRGIAALTSCYHVVPGMGATLGARQDVIERQVLGATAVLTGMAIATEDFPTTDRRYLPVPAGIATRQANVLRNL